VLIPKLTMTCPSVQDGDATFCPGEACVSRALPLLERLLHLLRSCARRVDLERLYLRHRYL